MLLEIFFPISHQDSPSICPIWAFSVFCLLSEEGLCTKLRGPTDPRKIGAVIWQVAP